MSGGLKCHEFGYRRSETSADFIHNVRLLLSEIFPLLDGDGAQFARRQRVLCFVQNIWQLALVVAVMTLILPHVYRLFFVCAAAARARVRAASWPWPWPWPRPQEQHQPVTAPVPKDDDDDGDDD